MPLPPPPPQSFKVTLGVKWGSCPECEKGFALQHHDIKFEIHTYVHVTMYNYPLLQKFTVAVCVGREGKRSAFQLNLTAYMVRQSTAVKSMFK